ncbi:hypothetical protein FO519_006012 [Halicephalobus sp. NKZ332]|nr:hypothetical protein FO519_006012 [Halicephalobus sp. NKZ332]
MSSDAFSLDVEENMIFDDSKFPVVKGDFCSSSVPIPDVNLKRKYPSSCIVFPLKEKLPIISYLQNRFLPETDLETAAWGADFLSVEVYQKVVFIRIRTLEFAGQPGQTLEQKNSKARIASFFTDSEGAPRWRNYVLRKMKIGEHKLYFNALIDGKKKDGTLVEIKSRKGRRLKYNSALKLWLENYLSGIESSLVGYHNEIGNITKIQYFSSNLDLSNLHRIKKEKLDEEISKIEEVLTKITSYIKDNSEVKKFEVVKLSEKSDLKFDKEEEYDFLTPEFKSQFSGSL